MSKTTCSPLAAASELTVPTLGATAHEGVRSRRPRVGSAARWWRKGTGKATD
jgi:hypothetical protein